MTAINNELCYQVQSMLFFASQDIAVVVSGFTATSWHGMGFGSIVS
jgi:hypothetical protein